MVPALLPTFGYTQKQRRSHRNERKPSFRRTHKMFKTVPSLQIRPHIEKEEPKHQNTSSFLPGTRNTVNEGNTATLSSPNTHPSFLGIKGPLTSGSLMPPARPPNLQGTKRSLHLTNSAQRIQKRGYRRCARNAPKKKYPHFLPIQRRCCSTQCFLGSQTSTCLISQGKSHCPTEGHFPQPLCADRSRHMPSLFRLRCRPRIRSTH